MFQMVVLPQAYYQDLSVVISVEDENDNEPQFLSEALNIELTENTRQAYSLDSQMAYDPDLGKRHFIKKYFF